jgi:hypothetical protein
MKKQNGSIWRGIVNIWERGCSLQGHGLSASGRVHCLEPSLGGIFWKERIEGFNSRLPLAKQALYHLSQTSVHFALVILEMGVVLLNYLSWLASNLNPLK